MTNMTKDKTNEEEINQFLKDSPIKENGPKTALEVFTPESLRNIAGMGMKKVDPKDIRPPQILLIQKTSDLSLMTDKGGKIPQIGQFYHTGKREVYDAFDCNILFAAKGTFVNKNRDGELWDQYLALGSMLDKTLFGMSFRSTALYALSSLFSAAKSQQVPMFAFKIKIETKLIKGEKGEWFVPVVRVGEIVSDPEHFDYLYSLAKDLDTQGEAVATNLEEDHEPGIN